MSNPYGGIPPANANQVLTVEESSWNVADPLGALLYRSDHGSDGGGLSEPQSWQQHMADGQILSQGNTMTGDMYQLQRTYMFQYRLFDSIARNLTGLPTTDVTENAGLTEYRKYPWPTGTPPRIVTNQVYQGSPTDSQRMTGARIVSINEDINRNADGGTVAGNITWDGNYPQEGVTPPGAIAANAKYIVYKKGALNDGTIAWSIYNVPVSKIFRFNVPNPAGNYQINGMVAKGLTDNLAAWQASLRATGGSFANAILGGTITPAIDVKQTNNAGGLAFLAEGGGGNPLAPKPGLVDGLVVVSQGGLQGNGFFGYLWNGTPRTVTSIRVYLKAGAGAGTVTYTVQTSANSTTGGDGVWTDNGGPVDVDYTDEDGYYDVPIDGPITAAGIRLYMTTHPGFMQTTELELNGAPAPGVLNITVEIPFADGNPATPAVTGTNAAGNIAVERAYNPSGALTENTVIPVDSTGAEIKALIEALTFITTVTVTAEDGTAYDPDTDNAFLATVTAPANTKIGADWVSGSGWAVRQIALGGPAALVRKRGPYATANQAYIYLVKDLDDLATVDWDDLPNMNNQGGDQHILKQCRRLTFSMSALWVPSYSINGIRTPTDMIAGARTVAMTLMLPKNSAAGSDYRFFKDLELQCTSGGFYIVRRFICDGYDNRRISYVGRSDTVQFEIENGAEMRTFNLQLYQTPDGSDSLWWDHRQPADV